MSNIEIRNLRKALDLTLQELADSVGVHKITVWRWEHGFSNPSRLAEKQLRQLQEKFKCS